MLSFVYFAFIICWFTIKAQEWDYESAAEWYKDYPECGGDTQSPINIDYNTINMNCPITLENGHESLVWSIVDLKRTYTIENNGHSLEMVPHDLIYSSTNPAINSPIAVLQNNFMTSSGEHKNYCFDRAHIHYGSNSNMGSEHTVNNLRAPMEIHFVHYSCDYDSLDEALNDKNVEDKYVLAVVTVFFKIGQTNHYFEHILDQIDYLIQVDDHALITNSDISGIIPDIATDFIYYEGSLTTPGCNEAVRWHIIGERLSISEEQLELLRQLEGHDHENTDNLDNNMRPIQENKNTVYYCTPHKDGQLPPGIGDESEDELSSSSSSSSSEEGIGKGYRKKKDNEYVTKGNSGNISSMDILMIAFVIAFVCLVIGFLIGNKFLSNPFQQKTFVMDDI